MTLERDYRAIREGAALGEIARRGQIVVTGADRAAFLHGLLTNDIQALQPGTGCYAGWLTAQGRMIADMHVLDSGDMMFLDVPEQQAAALVERLDQFIFSEDVQAANLSDELVAVGVHGPKAASLL